MDGKRRRSKQNVFRKYGIVHERCSFQAGEHSFEKWASHETKSS
jgi:hypothetical protein